MSALRNQVIDDTLDKVKLVYLDRETSKWWNQRRKSDDTAVFCGWFWVKGDEEAGPFRTRSSAVRDAYYRFVLEREVPNVGHNAITRNSKTKSKTRPRQNDGVSAQA